jgi:drug/metabolite transporter (DMT)-like permease
MSSHQRGWPGIIMALASAICFSTLAIFVKLAFSFRLSVTTVVVLRMALASVFLWLTMLLTKRERSKIARQDWLILLGGVVLTYGLSEVAYFAGLQILPAGIAIFLVYVYPIGVVFLAYLLYGERPTRRKIGVALICLLGCAVLSFEPNGEMRLSPWGIFLILLAAIGIALYTVYSQKLLKNYSPLVISAWTLPPVGLVFALLDWNNLPNYAEFPFGAWMTMLGAAVVGTYIALLLYLGAVVRIGATHAALICTIEPVSTTLQATWILGERMTPWQMLGAAFILGGLVALEWPNGRGQKAENKGARTFLSAMRVD